MIRIKTDEQIEKMRIAGKVTAAILYELADYVRPGISTADIDAFVEQHILEAGMSPSFKGYNGFPAAACVSVNDEIVHGIPDADRKLAEGDIVSVDIGATYDGWVSDAARTYPVGEVSGAAGRLIKTTRESFFEGIKCAREGFRLSDISSAVQEYAEGAGYSVVRDFVGHGIGRDMHEDPQIKNYGAPHKGPKLMKGMALAIEPMINEGGYDTELLDNEWTAVTADGKLSAHYENTVIVTSGEPLIITLDDRDKER